MTYPTQEEIKQIALECGLRASRYSTFTPLMFSGVAKELQTFFLRGIEMGRKMQRESDATVCKKSDRYRGDYFAELIRNNTGE